jgi:hypothetical protein
VTPEPTDWDAQRAVEARPITVWSGVAWRGHRRTYDGTDWRGSLLVSARYHRAPDAYPPELTWPALYLSLSYGVCLGEVLRHLPAALFAQVTTYRFSKLRVHLTRVIDCRNLPAMGLRPEDLFRDFDFRVGQEVAAAARRLGCEGLFVPSATGFPDPNLIVFPDMLDSTSAIELIESVDPKLYVDRTSI